MIVLYAVGKVRHFLEEVPFVTKIDRGSLKYFLDQRVYSMVQHKGVLKPLELNYTIQYKQRSYNTATYALSRRELEDHMEENVVHCIYHYLCLDARSTQQLYQ